MKMSTKYYQNTKNDLEKKDLNGIKILLKKKKNKKRRRHVKDIKK